MAVIWRTFRKRGVTRMVQVNSADDVPDGLTGRSVRINKVGFAVVSPQGELSGPWGSWLAIDSRGLPYIIANEEHARIYDEVVAT